VTYIDHGLNSGSAEPDKNSLCNANNFNAKLNEFKPLNPFS